MLRNSDIRNAQLLLEAQEAIRADAREIGRKTSRAFKTAASAAGINRRSASERKAGIRGMYNRIGYRVRMRDGYVESIGWRTYRYAFILATNWKSRSGKAIEARDWISRPASKAQRELADISSKHEADSIVKLIDFKKR